MEAFWAWFGRVDNIFGVLTVIFSGYAAWRLRRQAKLIIDATKQLPALKDFQKLRTDNEGVKSLTPVAFAVCVTPSIHSIASSVQTFLNFKGWKMPIEELNMNGINEDKDLEDFVNKIKEKKIEFQARGFTEVHLFINGPVQAGVIIGAMFDTWIPVKLYHKPTPAPPQVYEYWMPLI